MTRASEDTDAALAAAWQAGDRAAGARLLRSHLARLDRYFRARVGSRDAEDLRQETVLRLMDALSRFRFESSFSTYLYRIAHRTLCDWIRHRNTARGRQNEVARWPGELHDELNAHAWCDDARDLTRALRSLTTEDRALIELVHLEGFSYAEAADLLEIHCAVGTLRARVCAIKRQLRAELGEHEARRALR